MSSRPLRPPRGHVVHRIRSVLSETLKYAEGPDPQEWRLAQELQASEKGEMLLRGVGTLQYPFPPNASVQWQPDGLTIHTKEWFLGAGFLGAPPISLRVSIGRPGGVARLHNGCRDLSCSPWPNGLPPACLPPACARKRPIC